MKLLSIGVSFQSSKVDYTTFRSMESALDYDAAIWDSTTTLNDYYRDASGSYRGLPSLSEHDSVRLRNDIARRRGEFADLLQVGRSLVVFTPPPVACYVFTGDVQTSGTGRNAQRTRIVAEVDVNAALPIALKTAEGQGEKIELRGGDAIRRFWQKNADIMYYRASIKTPVDEPAFVVAGTSRVIGGIQRAGNGILLTLPAIHIPPHYSRQKRGALERRFIDSLIELLAELSRTSEDVTLPTWTERFLLPGERDRLADVEDLRAQAATIREATARAESQLEDLRKHKGLLTTSGSALEALVRHAFEELGCEVAPGKPGRDDLIIKYSDAVAVVEVKGVSKSAAEKHAAQLEKWVSEYYTDTGVKPKGILIVNAFRDLPLDERTERAFPQQMLTYAQNRDHCLVTTAQLLVVLFDVNANPEKKGEVMRQLLDTAGVLSSYQDWKSVIAVADE